MRGSEPRNFVQSCLLLLLRERPDHGYDLVERLRSLSEGDNDASGVYRALRSLEEQGMVSSSWSTSSAGPARRTYHLTTSGSAALGQQVRSLEARRDALQEFLARYARSVAAVETPLPRQAGGNGRVDGAEVQGAEVQEAQDGDGFREAVDRATHHGE